MNFILVKRSLKQKSRKKFAMQIEESIINLYFLTFNDNLTENHKFDWFIKIPDFAKEVSKNHLKKLNNEFPLILNIFMTLIINFSQYLFIFFDSPFTCISKFHQKMTLMSL